MIVVPTVLETVTVIDAEFDPLREAGLIAQDLQEDVAFSMNNSGDPRALPPELYGPMLNAADALWALNTAVKQAVNREIRKQV